MRQKVSQRPILSPTGFLLPTDCKEITADWQSSLQKIAI